MTSALHTHRSRRAVEPGRGASFLSGVTYAMAGLLPTISLMSPKWFLSAFKNSPRWRAGDRHGSLARAA